jgi:hypothetical protein
MMGIFFRIDLTLLKLFVKPNKIILEQIINNNNHQ